LKSAEILIICGYTFSGIARLEAWQDTQDAYAPRKEISPEGNQAAASCRAILASVRAIASRAVRISSGVAGRNPCFFKMRSPSATVIGGPVNLPVRSVREKIGEVDFSILLNVADGIIEGLVVCHGRAGQLATQALCYSEDVPVGESVRGVEAGHAFQFAASIGKENDAECGCFPGADIPPCIDKSRIEPLNEVLFRHPRRMSRGLPVGNHVLWSGAERGVTIAQWPADSQAGFGGKDF